MAPLVSILIPTYNRSKHIKRAILSCLSQTYENLEIIITDNSSNSETEKVISEFDNKNIKYYKNSENIGPILNWKKAFEFSKGDWIVILPDDDYFLNPFYISDCMEISSKFEIDLIITDCIIGYSTNKYIGKSNHKGILDAQYILKDFWKNSYIPCISNLFSRKVTQNIDFFYSNDILYSDIELYLKILQKSKQVYFYDIPSVYYTMHDANIVKTMNINSLISNAVFINSIFNDNLSMRNALMKRYCLFISNIYPKYSYELVFKLSKEYKLGSLWLLSTLISLFNRKIKKIIKWILKK